MKFHEIKRDETVRIQTNDVSDRIPLEIVKEAYKEYVEQFGNDQTLARLQERGGFGINELIRLLYLRIKRLETK